MTLKLVALGSSFASGPAIPPVVDADALRSGRNYPRRLAASLRADLVDRTSGGATTAHVLDEPQTTVSGKVFEPQILAVARDADIVTVTVGGNDLDYSGSLLFAAYGRADPDGQIARNLAPAFPNGLHEPSPEAVTTMETNLVRIVEAVADRTEHARILLVDYQTTITEGTGGSAWFTDDERALFLRIRTALEEAHVHAAARSGVELVQASQLSRAHGIGSPEPWVSDLTLDPDRSAGTFHPNALGMERVAEELHRVLTAA